ncbi:MAG: hypothetical protein LQ343_000996 [Gyalolechia ehrenbergii]|nr:MAG: hypothetical protein LQ343_000996 [Gyalolechia ehrenbergii]
MVDDLKKLVAGLIKEAQNAESTDKAQALASIAEKDVLPAGSGARASRLEYKTVDERWNDKISRYETMESTPAGEVDGLDEYDFIARARIDKKTSEPVFYVDIKSEKLRDILRTIERNLFYQYLPELEVYRTKLSDDVGQEAAEPKHLSLLADFIKSKYASTTDRLFPLLKNGEIIYELLWAFLPNTIVYTTCLDTEKSLCFRFDMSEEKTTATGIMYFHISIRTELSSAKSRRHYLLRNLPVLSGSSPSPHFPLRTIHAEAR